MSSFLLSLSKRFVDMKAFFIVLPLLICLVWLAILTLDCALSRRGREQRVLAAYALVCTLLYGCHAWHFMGPHTAFGPVDVLYSFCTLACYVVYYLYIKSLTEKDGISWRDALWLLPAVLTSLLAAVLLLLGKTPRRCRSSRKSSPRWKSFP